MLPFRMRLLAHKSMPLIGTHVESESALRPFAAYKTVDWHTLAHTLFARWMMERSLCYFFICLFARSFSSWRCIYAICECVCLSACVFFPRSIKQHTSTHIKILGDARHHIVLIFPYIYFLCIGRQLNAECHRVDFLFTFFFFSFFFKFLFRLLLRSDDRLKIRIPMATVSWFTISVVPPTARALILRAITPMSLNAFHFIYSFQPFHLGDAILSRPTHYGFGLFVAVK